MQRSRILMIALATIAFSAVGLASDDGNFAVRYLLPAGTVNISNTGLSWGAVLAGVTAPTVNINGCPYVQNGVLVQCPAGTATTSPGVALGNGTLCINVYVVSPDEQLQACCSFPASPNSLWSYKYEELVSNTLTGRAFAGSNSAIIKLVASGIPQGSSTTGCSGTSTVPGAQTTPNAATVGQTDSHGNLLNPTLGQLAPGVVAWARNDAQTGETSFVNSNVTKAELARLTRDCNGIVLNGTNSGICPQPKLGGR